MSKRLCLWPLLALGLVLAPALSWSQAILNASAVKRNGTSGGDLTGDDAATTSSNIPIGFNFSLFGQTRTRFGVSTNGLMFFGATSTAYDNKNSLPGPDTLAPLWDDLESRLSRNPDELIFYKVVDAAPNRKLIVQWNNYGIYNTNNPFGTMQVILYETTNVIQFQYISLLTPGRSDAASGTVGIRGSGAAQIIHTFNGNPTLVQQGTSICWVPAGNSYTKSVINAPNADCSVGPNAVLTNQTAPPPDKPAGLVRAGDVFSWDPANNAASYTLVVATNPQLNGPIVNQSGVAGTSFDTNRNFTPGTTYYWTVRAVNPQGTTNADLQQFTIPLSAPVAVDDGYSVNQNGVLSAGATRNILTNDSDPQNDPLTAVLETAPPGTAAESFVLNADGTFVFDPVGTFKGTATFSYRVQAGGEDSNVATVRIQVNDVNFPPVGQADLWSVPEDRTYGRGSPGVLENDRDIDGDHLTAVLVSPPDQGGSLTLNADGSFTYTPPPDFNGADRAIYRASDGTAESADVDLVFAVRAVNDAPTAVPDAYSVAEDGHLDESAGLGVLANDDDPDNDPLTAGLVSDVSNGSLTLNPDGSFNYVPDADFNGSDSFEYRVNDGTVDGNTATVVITVNAVNDAPVASPDSYHIGEDGFLDVTKADGVLRNDADRDALDTLVAQKVTSTASGVLHLNSDGSFDYRPDADFDGTDSFTYQVFDGKATSQGATTVTILVDPDNDSPVAQPDAYTLSEDSVLVVPEATGLTANDTDVESGHHLLVLLETSPANGALRLSPGGGFEYRPGFGFNGSDSFQYRATDGAATSAPVTVTLTVRAVNDPPLAGNDNYSIFEDSALVVPPPGLLVNDVDPDGDPLRALNLSTPANGSLRVNPDGSFSYAPDPDFNGLDTFQYIAVDPAKEQSPPATVVINVRGKNDDPVAVDDVLSVPEDGVLRLPAPGLLANDQDRDGDQLRVTILSRPANGRLQAGPDGSLAYYPNPNFNGIDSFDYVAGDGAAVSAPATVTITVNGLNDAPVAASDAYTVAEGGSLKVTAANGLLVNDFDTDGDSLSALLVDQPRSGTLQINLDGTFSYVPDPLFNGFDTFTYRATDGSAESNEVGVLLSVTAVNQAPVANADLYATSRDRALVVPPAGGLLANDSDPDGDPLTVVPGTQPSNGTLQLTPDGGITYTPNPGFTGSDSFQYRASDGRATSASVPVVVAVNAVNRPPLAGDDSYQTLVGQPLQVPDASGLLANDIDADGDQLSVLVTAAPANGALQLNPFGGFTYLPNPGSQGVDTFTYVASDGADGSNVATVSISVAPGNTAPLASADAYATPEGSTLQVSAGNGVLANDLDIDGNALRAVLISPPASGSLQLQPDGSFRYTPNPLFNGTDSFTYRASDGIEDSAVVRVSLVVNAVNQPPQGAGDVYLVLENAVLDVAAAAGVLANDVDPEGHQLQAVLVAPPASGSLSLGPDGSFRYAPDPGFTGSDGFTYRASDGAAQSATTPVSITVSPVASAVPPLAAADSYTVQAGTTLTENAAQGVLANDLNPGGGILTARSFSQPANGTVQGALDGSFTYRPAPGFVGLDAFTYVASNGLDAPPATVTIDVRSGNAPPVPGAPGFSIPTNATLQQAAPGVLAGASDPDGDNLTARLITPPANGTLQLDPDGSFVYTPAPGFSGQDSFTFVVNDGQLDSAPGTAIIGVLLPRPLAVPALGPPGLLLLLLVTGGIGLRRLRRPQT